MSDGDTLTGSQVVRVYGENLTAPFVTLTFGDVEYTPLVQGEDYIEFILTDNGAAIIAVDGSRFMSFEVEDIVTPTELTGEVSAVLRDSGNQNKPGSFRSTNGGCLNYPQQVDDTWVRFYMFVFFNEGVEVSVNDITTENCSIADFNFSAYTKRADFYLTPTDPNRVCYLVYNGFIFFVGNYTTN